MIWIYHRSWRNLLKLWGTHTMWIIIASLCSISSSATNYHREPHSTLFVSCNWHNTSLPLLHLQWSLIIFLDVVLHKPCISLSRKPWSYSVQTDVNMKYRSLYCTEKKNLGNSKNSTLRIWGTKTHVWGYLGRYFNIFNSNYSGQFGFGSLNKTNRNDKILVKDGKDRYTNYLKTMKTSKQVYHIQ